MFNLSKSIARLLSVFIVFNFLGFTTAVYNFQFHEKLHSHEAHIVHDHENDSHESHDECYTCDVKNHIVTQVATFITLNTETRPFFRSIEILQKDAHLAVVPHLFSGRLSRFSSTTFIR